MEEQTGDMDPAVNFRLIIVQTELERVKFLVRSLLRARLAKVRPRPSRRPAHLARAGMPTDRPGFPAD